MAHESLVSLEPDLGPVPAELSWPAGGSVFRPADTHAWSSQRVLDAERNLLVGTVAMGGPTVTHDLVDHVLAAWAQEPGRLTLGPDQAAAVRYLAAGGGQVAVLVGPAGTGKTTTLSAFRDVMTAGGARIIGLAPSAAAAGVLSDGLGVRTATIDQMRAAYEVRAQMEADSPAIAADTADAWNERWGIGPDTVVIVDEASADPRRTTSTAPARCDPRSGSRSSSPPEPPRTLPRSNRSRPRETRPLRSP